MKNITLTRTLSEKAQYDVIVCGGGVAGVAAAITAAQQGKSVLLLEKSNILGGLSTLGLVNLFVPMCNGYGKQIIFGLCEKWVRLSAKYGYHTIPEEWKNGQPKEPTRVRYIQRFSPYIFAMQLTQELRNSGADLLFDVMACDPVMEGKVCKGVITESKGGTEYYGCKMLIDTTGDCDVLRRGGVPTVAGQNFYTYWAQQITLDGCARAVEKQDIRYAYKDVCGGPVNLYGDDQPAQIPRWSGLTAQEVTDYLVTNQAHLLRNIQKDEPSSRDVAMIPLMPQLRTTCHIAGDYTLTIDDCYKHHEDSVCAINDFDHRGHLFEVPLGTLVRSDYPNMLTAGRSASASGYGWDVLRVIPPAILTGQAAGHAACHAIDEACPVAKVDIRKLQDSLEKDHVMIHFPDAYLPEDRTVKIRGQKASEIDGGHK